MTGQPSTKRQTQPRQQETASRTRGIPGLQPVGGHQFPNDEVDSSLWGRLRGLRSRLHPASVATEAAVPLDGDLPNLVVTFEAVLDAYDAAPAASTRA